MEVKNEIAQSTNTSSFISSSTGSSRLIDLSSSLSTPISSSSSTSSSLSTSSSSTSTSTSTASPLFKPVDEKHKLFIRGRKLELIADRFPYDGDQSERKKIANYLVDYYQSRIQAEVKDGKQEIKNASSIEHDVDVEIDADVSKIFGPRIITKSITYQNKRKVLRTPRKSTNGSDDFDGPPPPQLSIIELKDCLGFGRQWQHMLDTDRRKYSDDVLRKMTVANIERCWKELKYKVVVGYWNSSYKCDYCQRKFNCIPRSLCSKCIGGGCVLHGFVCFPCRVSVCEDCVEDRCRTGCSMLPTCYPTID